MPFDESAVMDEGELNHSYVNVPVLKWNVSSVSVCLFLSYYHRTAMQKIKVGQPRHYIFEAACGRLSFCSRFKNMEPLITPSAQMVNSKAILG